MDEKFAIERLLTVIMGGGKVSDSDKQAVMDALNSEITEKPFSVAVVGQAGVGNSTTLNSVFGLKYYTSDVA